MRSCGRLVTSIWPDDQLHSAVREAVVSALGTAGLTVMWSNGSGEARYDASISYSHSADRPLAVAVQTGLQQFAKPWYQRRALRVFRDESSLSATPELWPTILTRRARHPGRPV